jgi:hypothetical protein
MTQGNGPTVLACITNLSLPKKIADFNGMLKKNLDYGSDLSDIEVLLKGAASPQASDLNIGWSALKAMDAGDVLLFYHGASSESRAKSLLKQAEQQQLNKAPVEQSIKYAQRFGGTIFACGLVGDKVQWQARAERGSFHFQNRNFAPLDEITLFQHPLHASDFKDIVKINLFNSITTFKAHVFDELKKRLAVNNTLPNYLNTAKLAQ